MKTFYHGHSYTANPLACTAALASLDLVEKGSFIDSINAIQNNIPNLPLNYYNTLDLKIYVNEEQF